jgi:LysR family glycine cleavage system transcriptional activator
MTHRLPHLNSLRAFDAVARHMSFAKAAGELGVTPAAVSQQIKMLEDYLGLELFRRAKRAIFLTDAAQLMLPEVREGFDLVASGLSRARAQRVRRYLVVSITPSVAARWLMPRLERFNTLHPDIDIRLNTTTQVIEFSREDVDIAVRYGGGNWPGLEVIKLMSEEAFPVCSPKLLKGGHPLRNFGALRYHTLIHDDSMPSHSDFPTWAFWLEAAGASEIDATRGLHVNASMLAIQAAIDGQGVALGRSVLVHDDLAKRRLVKPFNLTLPLRFGYYIVHPRKPQADPAVKAFKRWLLAEVGVKE